MDRKKSSKIDLLARLKVVRESAYVKRCHTIPIHGEYTVAQHCYGALNLLVVAHPDPSANLMKAVLWHDAHERYTGDIPSPALTSDGEFAKLHDRLAERVDRACGLSVELSDDDRLWLRAVDKAELLLWAKEQLAMGNCNAAAIVGNLASWFGHNPVPLQIKHIIEHYDIVRAPDELP